MLAQLDDPSAPARLAESEAECARLGIAPYPAEPAVEAGTPTAAGGFAAAIHRLARPALDREELLVELATSLSRELAGPVSFSVPNAPGEKPRLTLADGTGGRIEIAVPGPIPEANAEAVGALIRVAELVLEVAAVRGRTLPPSEMEPEVDPAGFVAVAPVTEGKRESVGSE